MNSAPPKPSNSQRLLIGLLVGAGFGAAVASWLPGGEVAPTQPAVHPVHRSAPPPGSGPRVYYDAVHGARHLHDRDNRRYRTDYHTIGGWFRFLESLRSAGYDVVPESHACFDRETLDAFDVVVIGEQTYHARFMSRAEVEALRGWVEDGGGLLLTVEHTNAHYMGDVFNRLAAPFPVRARFDSICDTDTSHRSARDWVRLTPAGEHPVTEGVATVHFYNGCSLDTEHGVLMSSAGSWSDTYAVRDKPVHNGDKRRQADELTGPLAGVAAFDYGSGRVVVLGDHNGLSNIELYVADHHRLGLNAIRWLAQAGPEQVEWDYADGIDLMVHTGAGSAFSLHQKTAMGGFRTVYAQLTREPHLRPWAHDTLQAGHELMLLAAPTEAYSEAEQAVLAEHLASDRPLIWLATQASVASPAGQLLQDVLQVDIVVGDSLELGFKRPLNVHGPPELTSGIFRQFVPPATPSVRVDGLTPVVQLRAGGWHVEEHKWRKKDVLIDLISRRENVWVVAPFDLFDDHHLPGMFGEKGDVVRQQTAELMLRLVKVAASDPVVLVD